MEEKFATWDFVEKVKILQREQIKGQEVTFIGARPSENMGLEKKSQRNIQHRLKRDSIDT